MTGAREIIAKQFQLAHQDTCYPTASEGERGIAAGNIIEALTAAGYRILGPDEVDPVTVDRCAQLVEDRRHIYHSRGNTAAAIRALASGGKQ